jgi:hypothetical protein
MDYLIHHVEGFDKYKQYQIMLPMMIYLEKYEWNEDKPLLEVINHSRSRDQFCY